MTQYAKTTVRPGLCVMVHIETLNWLREEGSACLGGISAVHGVDFFNFAAI